MLLLLLSNIVLLQWGCVTFWERPIYPALKTLSLRMKYSSVTNLLQNGNNTYREYGYETDATKKTLFIQYSKRHPIVNIQFSYDETIEVSFCIYPGSIRYYSEDDVEGLCSSWYTSLTNQYKTPTVMLITPTMTYLWWYSTNYVITLAKVWETVLVVNGATMTFRDSIGNDINNNVMLKRVMKNNPDTLIWNITNNPFSTYNNQWTNNK